MSNEREPRPRKGNYAVWRYDQYPYFLLGKITAAKRREYPKPGQTEWVVETEEFGVGHWFACRVCIPPALGAEVKDLRDTLQAIMRQHQDEVRKRLNAFLVSQIEEKGGRAAAIVDKVLPDHATTPDDGDNP